MWRWQLIGRPDSRAHPGSDKRAKPQCITHGLGKSDRLTTRIINADRERNADHRAR